MQQLVTHGVSKDASVAGNARVSASHSDFVCICYIATPIHFLLLSLLKSNPILQKGRRQASVSPANKRRCMQVNVTSIVTKDDQVALLKARKEHGNKPAHLMDVVNNFANITDPDIVGVYRVTSGLPYDSAVVVMYLLCQSNGDVHKFLQKC